MEKSMPAYFHEKGMLVRKYLKRSTADNYTKARVISDLASNEELEWEIMRREIESGCYWQ
jgi:hypothetical protein